MAGQLTNLTPGMAIPFGGDRVTVVSAELAAAFTAGDRLVVVQSTGDLLRIASADWGSPRRPGAGSSGLPGGGLAISRSPTFRASARRDRRRGFAPSRRPTGPMWRRPSSGRTTSVVLPKDADQTCGTGLRTWRDASSGRGEIIERVPHKGWEAQLVRSGLGVVGFVFEGRPNVFADATGVLRSGNTVVFRIGSAALGTARAIVEHALDPALAETGLPEGAVGLVDSPTHAVGWALFSQPKLSLAVARGSGHAVGQLGAVARQSGISVSLHGTGGGWMVAGPGAHASSFAKAVRNSLDRKVCNTVNVCAIVRSRSAELAPVFLDALRQAAEGGGESQLWLPERKGAWFLLRMFRSDTVTGEGEVLSRYEVIADDGLAPNGIGRVRVTLNVVEERGVAVRCSTARVPAVAADRRDPLPRPFLERSTPSWQTACTDGGRPVALNRQSWVSPRRAAAPS